MRLRAASVALALSFGCFRPYPGVFGYRPRLGPLEDLDAELDRAESDAFLARWRELGRQKTAEAAARRADLALEALANGLSHRLPGIRAEELAAEGERDAERAVRGAPSSAAGWRALARFRLRRGLEADAAAAGCRAADLAPKRADDQEACGDLLRAQGDAAGAVARYQSAFLVSADRAQQFELIARIESTSLTPASDVAALPPEVVAQYRQAVEASRERPPPPPPPDAVPSLQEPEAPDDGSWQ